MNPYREIYVPAVAKPSPWDESWAEHVKQCTAEERAWKIGSTILWILLILFVIGVLSGQIRGAR